MLSKREKRERLFDSGAEAVERLFPLHTGHYICPQCVTMFDRTAIYDCRLTLDHIPARSIGSRSVMLTCEPCNSTAGHFLDAHRWRLERMHGGGRAKKPVRGRLDARVASISDLRSAYLVAFAALGYSWALSPSLASVRQQIGEPESAVLSGYHLQLNGESPTQHTVVVLKEPLAALWVQLGRAVILLPGTRREPLFYETIPSFVQKQRTFRGHRLVWPTRPRYSLDSIFLPRHIL